MAYIRQKKHRRDGWEYTEYSLVESARVNGKPRQTILAHLGPNGVLDPLTGQVNGPATLRAALAAYRAEYTAAREQRGRRTRKLGERVNRLIAVIRALRTADDPLADGLVTGRPVRLDRLTKGPG